MKRIKIQVKGLWLLYIRLLISYLGVFLISVWLTDSIVLFIGQTGKGGGVIVGLIGFIALTVGIMLVLLIVFNYLE